MTEPKHDYGNGDSTFRAAGGEPGIRALVDSFYDIMEHDARFSDIWKMHPPTRDDKLARFLCAWSGGPRLYSEKYGAISIPGVHAHLAITADHTGQWLSCMEQALIQRDYPEDFRTYLLPQLAKPAERVRAICARNITRVEELAGDV
jgi:hemoglobin